MENYSGHWVGEMQGTNLGGFAIQLEQQGQLIQGKAKFDEPKYGSYEYSVRGIVGDKLSLQLLPEANPSGLNLGPIDVTAQSQGPDQITGHWESIDRRHGNFSARRAAGARSPDARSSSSTSANRTEPPVPKIDELASTEPPDDGSPKRQRQRRNKELQRLLLLQVRDGEEPVGLKDFSEAQRVYNTVLLIDDGLVEGKAVRGADGRIVSIVTTELTTAGHEFLERGATQTDRSQAGIDQPQTQTDQPQTQQPNVPENTILIGGRTHFSRVATDEEIVLGVKGYANVVSKLLKSSDDKDLCLAIFGPWGRGKTFLMEQTIAKLTEQKLNPSADYEVVRFSAWKYPSRPEVWVHLFESFSRQLAKVGWFRSLAFTILTGIQRHRVAKLWFAWVGLILTAMPKTWLLRGAIGYISKFESLVAAAIVFFVVVFLWEFWTTTSHLRRYYLSGTRHFEKLGLQGTIGDDLKALLKGWVQSNLKRRDVKSGLRIFWAAMVALAAVIFLRSYEALGVAIALSVVVLAIPTFVSFAFTFSARSPSRILLVVDDLDRCQVDHLLAVVESIKLLLEDEEVSRRVQVVMLIEEDVLKHATWEKYKGLVEWNAQKAIGTNYDGKRIIRESFEKLFTAHLRLGPLKPQDVADIVFKFGGKTEGTESSAVSRSRASELSQTATRSSAANNPHDEGESDPGEGRQAHDPEPNEIGSGQRLAAQVGSPIQNHFDAESTMSQHEKQVIFAALTLVYGDKQGELGPRALRAIMFRYQLARLLLEELGERTWSPAMLAMMIVKRHLEGTIDAKFAQGDSDIVTRVAEQVA